MTIGSDTSAGEQGFVIEKEQKTDFTNVEKLYDTCFGGTSRWQRPIYTLRSNRLPLESLCFVIRQRGLQGKEQTESTDMAMATSKLTNLESSTPTSTLTPISATSRIIAALRFWNVRIVYGLGSRATSKGGGANGNSSDKPALLFGPLAVVSAMQGRGFGKKLIEHGIAEARRLNHGGVLISGVGAYYRPFGFRATCVGSIDMPRPSPGHIVMGLELKPNYLLSARGEVLRAR